MSKLIDLSGKRFGKLTVIKPNGRTKQGQLMWLCKCDCGNYTTVGGQNIRTGKTKSCGCLHHENKSCVTHGMTGTVLYTRWMNMKSRCYNKSNKRYRRYGGRGISVCQEWLDDFKNFYDWCIENGYSEDLTLDRINNDGNYCPENCRFVGQKEQANNRSSNEKFEINGVSMTLSEWIEHFYETLEPEHDRTKLQVYKIVYSRLYDCNWSAEKALTTPIKHLNHTNK